MEAKYKIIAPCGMNCNICYSYLREKDKCPGCRFLTSNIRVSIARCRIRNCEQIKNGKLKFCFECEQFPCIPLKHLDKRYRNKYNMSQIENLEFIKKNGIGNFLDSEKIKWTCPGCGEVICVHKKTCSVGNKKM